MTRNSWKDQLAHANDNIIIRCFVHTTVNVDKWLCVSMNIHCFQNFSRPSKTTEIGVYVTIRYSSVKNAVT